MGYSGMDIIIYTELLFDSVFNNAYRKYAYRNIGLRIFQLLFSFNFIGVEGISKYIL